MNRGELRQKALSLRSRQVDNDDDYEEEVNTVVIDPALKRLASEVPEALLPDDETVTILSDRTSTSLGRTVAGTADEYVLSLGAANLAGASAITADGTWDGVMHIEVEYDGHILRRQCREFWLDGDTNNYYVSLDRPWNYPTALGMSFRIFQPYVFTRDDVTQVIDGRLFDSKRALIQVLPAGFMRLTYNEDFRGQSSGVPAALSRRKHIQLPAPNRTPSVALSEGGFAMPPTYPWQDDREPPGIFAYRYTYVWGTRSAEQRAPGGSSDPMWESAPSPASENIEVTDLPCGAVILSNLVDIDWMVNFRTNPTTLRDKKSGMRKRIYRARVAINTGGTTRTDIEAPGVFFFLDEVEGDVTEYVDDGSIIPDYFRRLPESHGYWSWACTPHQDADYEMDLRVTRRPLSLLCDTDTPQVHPDFEDMLLLLVQAGLAMLDKQPADAAALELQFQGRVEQWRSKDANPASYIPAIPWVPDYNEQPMVNFYGRYTSN